MKKYFHQKDIFLEINTFWLLEGFFGNLLEGNLAITVTLVVLVIGPGNVMIRLQTGVDYFRFTLKKRSP